ncbi:tetratricopeptide repeat protein [Actinomadura sp. B10D3]|uniref:tetratricopeptide repeat protein n=1 Tax=Actinomadura sp. B10D3 TaxID=3153557 RepID=UPI00325DE265
MAGAHDGALDQYRAALELARAGPVPYDQARAHTGIGDVHHRLGDTAAARDHWRSALEIYSRLGTTDVGALRARLSGESVSRGCSR